MIGPMDSLEVKSHQSWVSGHAFLLLTVHVTIDRKDFQVMTDIIISSAQRELAYKEEDFASAKGF